jgi:hypothetical protein
MSLIGYARVSSLGQSLDIQLGKLEHCDKIFQEKKSGITDKRSRLVKLDDELQARLKALGERCERSPHWLMKKANARTCKSQPKIL